MALVAIASAAAGLAVGFATARVFGQHPPQTLELQAGDETRAVEQLRALQMVCQISATPSTRRHALALDGVEFSRSLLEHIVHGPVLAGAVVDEQGMELSGLGAREYREAAGSFAARLEGLASNAWRVKWRSSDGVELTAQRCPLSRVARWLVCVASGAPVDPVALSRIAAETGLLAQLGEHRPTDVAPLSGPELRGRPALAHLGEHIPLLMAELWTTNESGFDLGRLRVPQTVVEAHDGLHRWASLVEHELGSSRGVCVDVGAERFGFHPVGEGAELALATPGGRGYPWQRINAAARQLYGDMTTRRAS